MQWLKEIPSHWEEKRAKYIYQKQNRIPDENDDVITCFRDGEVTLRKNRRTTGFTESFKEIGYQGIKRGDLVIHQMDAFAGATGVSDSDGKSTPVYSVCTPIDNQSLTKYHAMVIRLMGLNGFIQSLYRGIRERSSDFRFETFARQFLPLPPLAEQEKIVSYLEDKTSKIDAYVADKEKEIELLQELKQKTIADAVTKGLNPDAKMKDSGISWIGEIPEHWETRRAKFMFIKNKRERRPEDEVITCFRDGQVTLRKNRRLTGFTESEKFDGYQGIRKGDLVIHQMDAFAGSIGVSDSDGMGTSVYHCCTPTGDYNVYYYAYLIRQMALSGFIQSLYKGIRERSSDFSFPVFGNQYLIIPPSDEQQAIVAYIEEKCEKIDKLASELQSEIDYLKEYKQRLIADCVTGQVNVQNEMI